MTLTIISRQRFLIIIVLTSLVLGACKPQEETLPTLMHLPQTTVVVSHSNPKEASQLELLTNRWRVSRDKVASHACMDTDCAIVTTYKLGDIIIVLNTENGWHKILTTDTNTSYIQVEFTEEININIRATSPIPTENPTIQQLNVTPTPTVSSRAVVTTPTKTTSITATSSDLLQNTQSSSVEIISTSQPINGVPQQENTSVVRTLPVARATNQPVQRVTRTAVVVSTLIPTALTRATDSDFPLIVTSTLVNNNDLPSIMTATGTNNDDNLPPQFPQIQPSQAANNQDLPLLGNSPNLLPTNDNSLPPSP